MPYVFVGRHPRRGRTGRCPHLAADRRRGTRRSRGRHGRSQLRWSRRSRSSETTSRASRCGPCDVAPVQRAPRGRGGDGRAPTGHPRRSSRAGPGSAHGPIPSVRPGVGLGGDRGDDPARRASRRRDRRCRSAQPTADGGCRARREGGTAQHQLVASEEPDLGLFGERGVVLRVSTRRRLDGAVLGQLLERRTAEASRAAGSGSSRRRPRRSRIIDFATRAVRRSMTSQVSTSEAIRPRRRRRSDPEQADRRSNTRTFVLGEQRVGPVDRGPERLVPLDRAVDACRVRSRKRWSR